MTVEDVMVELKNSDNESDDDSSESEDDFEAYIDENMEQENCSEESSEDEQSDNEEMDAVIPSIPSYTCQPGITMPISGDRPLDIFSLFVDRNMLQHIVDQTNLNAEQYIASHSLAPHSRIRQWMSTLSLNSKSSLP